MMNLCAEVMAYSSVVGSGVLIVGNKGKGPMVGQIAYLCHTDTLRDKGLQIAMSEAIAKALNELFAARQAPASPEVQKLVAEAEARGSKAMSESDFDCLVLDGIAEAMKAMRKFPQPNYVISKVAEEAGEVVKAAIHCAEGRETAENLRGEMKQLIAMIYRLWVEGDQVHGLPPVSAAIRKGETL